LKKATKIVLILTLIVVGLVFSPLTLSVSNEPCESCHRSRGYYQYLDILESDSGNQLPTSLNVNQTVTIKVVVRNDVNSPRYTELSSVSLTLRSVFGHFQVSNPTYSISNMPAGTATATWQVTATSEGYDYLDIQASGINSHYSSFSDSYSPTPLITIGSPTGTPPPLPTPTPAPSTPTPTSQPSSTTAPSSTVSPTNTPTTSTPTSSAPTATPTDSSTQNPTTTTEATEPASFDWSTATLPVAAVTIALIIALVLVVIKRKAKKSV
jgi:hypothetical protein